MSKMDDMRAMREAKFERASQRAAQTPARKAPARTTSPSAGVVDPVASPAADGAESSLCGHRAISGKTCTRERGHAAKSHRYS